MRRESSTFGHEVERWLHEAQAGSQEALGQLLEAFRGYLRAMAERWLPADLRAKVGGSDLVQETFLQAYRDFYQFEGEKPEQLVAWLLNICQNNLADLQASYHRARRDVRRELPLQAPRAQRLAESLLSSARSPDASVLRVEEGTLVRAAVQQLPMQQREILEWRFVEDRSWQEIGDRLGISEAAARGLCRRAVRDAGDLLGKLESPQK
jgi:RNA polymerase sigma-70 factor (ECF subfamily)